MKGITESFSLKLSASALVCGVVIGGTAGLGAVACQGGAAKSCITYVRATPSGPTVYSKCGGYWHEGGPTQT